MNTTQLIDALLRKPDAERLRIYDRLARYIGMELTAEVSTSSNASNGISSGTLSDEEPIELEENPSNKERKNQREKCSVRSKVLDNIYNNTTVSIIDSTEDNKPTEDIFGVSQEKNNNDDNDIKNICGRWLAIFAQECPSFPKALAPTEHRMRLVAARAKDFSDEDFRQACRAMEGSQWIASRGFGSFDWIVRDADHLTKLREGFYSRRGKNSLPALPLEGRPAQLFMLIQQAAQSFGRSDVDATSLALSVEETIAGDRYYKQLSDDDLKIIFDRGIKRQYAYKGLNVSGICSWMNEYKEMFAEKRRREQMVR